MVAIVNDYLTNSAGAAVVQLNCYLMIAMLIRWLLTIQMEPPVLGVRSCPVRRHSSILYRGMVSRNEIFSCLPRIRVCICKRTLRLD